jgi:putative endonuclease
MTADRQGSGRAWENAAAGFLASRGLTIVARGYRCRLGEIDIVCLDDATIVVVEVRARAKTAHGSAAETVDYRKRQKIINATRHFLMRNPCWFNHPLRFDVVAVDAIDTDEPQLQWLKGAFDAS